MFARHKILFCVEHMQSFDKLKMKSSMFLQLRGQLVTRGLSLNIKSKICDGPFSIIPGMYGIS